MITVNYTHDFVYVDMGSSHFPMLQFTLQAPEIDQPIDVDAYIDSGAELSLFDGSLLMGIGLDMGNGPERRYQTTAGTSITARVQRVVLVHDALGRFELEIGFSLSPISRNLLGRDFFDKVQIGFREHHLTFLVRPKP